MNNDFDLGQNPADNLNEVSGVLMAGLEVSPILRELPEEALLKLADKSHLKNLEQGHVLCHQGDVAHSLWLVLDGWLKMTRETLDGDEAVWDVLGPGHIAGLETLISPHCYTTRAVTTSSASVLVIPHNSLCHLLETEAGFAAHLLAHSLKQQRYDRFELEHRMHQSASQRIGCFLLKLAGMPTTGQVMVNLPFDKGLLAARLGMQPETFSRALAKLRAETDLIMDGAKVTIPSVARLEAYTCSSCTGTYPQC